MTSNLKSVADAYDKFYKESHHFRYPRWLYKPFVAAVLRDAGVAPGQRILDVGCGQGFFSALFAELGYCADGVDVSHEAVLSAQRGYPHLAERFAQGDVLNLDCGASYDAVFVRGLSSYNTSAFATSRATTDALLKYVRPGGVLIFSYCTKFKQPSKNDGWIHHDLSETVLHFSAYEEAQVCFSIRLEAVLLRVLAGEILTRINMAVSRMFGIGGELIAIVRKP